MDLHVIDKVGLIREAFRIEGISDAECRSIFVDWAIRLPAGVPQRAALQFLIETYASDAPDHPMTAVLQAGLSEAGTPIRRGGRRSRMGDA